MRKRREFHPEGNGARVDRPAAQIDNVIYGHMLGGEPVHQYEEVGDEQVYDNPPDERLANHLENIDGDYEIMHGNVNNEEALYSVPRSHDSSRDHLLKQQPSYRTQSAENSCSKLECTLLEDSDTHSRYTSHSPHTPSRVSTLPSPLNKGLQVYTLPSTNCNGCSLTSDLSDSLPPPMARPKPRESSPPAAAPNSPSIQQRNKQYSSRNQDRPLPRVPHEPRPVCLNDMGISPSAITNHYSNSPVPHPRKSPPVGQPTCTSRPEPEGRQNSIDPEIVYHNVRAHDHMYQ